MAIVSLYLGLLNNLGYRYAMGDSKIHMTQFIDSDNLASYVGIYSIYLIYSPFTKGM